MKRRVLGLFGAQPSEWQDAVVSVTLDRLQPTLSEPVLSVLDKCRADGGHIVLATAAPDVYVRPLAQTLAAECVATASNVAPGWTEMIGTRKAQACTEVLSAHTFAKVVVLTDHQDDLPLLRLADEAIIQAPERRFRKIAQELASVPGAVAPTHLDPTAVQPDGKLWLWMDDRPHGPLDTWEVRTILSKHRHALVYVGDGRWHRIRPGQSLGVAIPRRECPLPPSSAQRLITYLRRRVQRDWLGLYH